MRASPLVTVCVRAYRAARFLLETLTSFRGQTLTNFRVRVAIEPDGAETTLEACADLAKDDRFELVVNDATLGWTGNIRHLLRQVETPLFAILPHDDLWHPHYLSALAARLFHAQMPWLRSRTHTYSDDQLASAQSTFQTGR